MSGNLVRRRWRHDEVAVNCWLHLPSAYATELLAHQGWDSLTIDLQHGPIDDAAAYAMLQACAATPTAPFARVAWNDPASLMRLLDAGCLGVICPMVNTAAEAERFVGACRYPPRGYRSFGPNRARLTDDDYVARADDTVVTLAMVETAQALDELDSILDVAELDGVFVGPADLGQSLGLGARIDPEEPRLLAAFEHVSRRARRRGLAAGIFTGSPAYARRMAGLGFRFLTVASDARLLAAAAQHHLDAFWERNHDDPE